MSIFSRISDIVAANLNALLDKAENPEAMIAQVVREMEDGLARAKRYGAGAIAVERRLGRDRDLHRERVVFWKERARQALASDREDLARTALARKLENEDLLRVLDTQYAHAQETAATVRAAIRALEARLAEARRKQRSLIARHRAVRARAEVNRFLGRELAILGQSHTRFGDLEARIEDLEDEIGVQIELNESMEPALNELANVEREQAITAELAALRAEMPK
jgi:phage shock protein A